MYNDFQELKLSALGMGSMRLPVVPSLLELYNEHNFSEGGFIAPMALAAIPENKQPKACIACRKCEAVCPQQIKISEVMSNFAEELGM